MALAQANNMAQTVISQRTSISLENGRHFADDIFKYLYIFLNETPRTLTQISMKLGPIVRWQLMMLYFTDAYMYHSDLVS